MHHVWNLYPYWVPFEADEGLHSKLRNSVAGPLFARSAPVGAWYLTISEVVVVPPVGGEISIRVGILCPQRTGTDPPLVSGSWRFSPHLGRNPRWIGL